MKEKKVIVILMLIIILLIVIIYTLISKNTLNNQKMRLKEMSENEQVLILETHINNLQKSHTEYANYIQSCKEQIATALTNQKIATSEDETLETMAENIEKIFQVRTSDATATADNISEGKTAYVNGERIVGTGADNNSHYEEGKSIMACEYLTISCNGLATGTDYYTGTGSNSANSGITITVNNSGATVNNSNSYGGILYASDLARYYCKTTGVNIADIECSSRLPAKASFTFKKITLNCTLTATLTDTYTNKGSVSASSSGTIVINSDGTYEKSDFVSGWSGTLYSSGLARYQCKTSLNVNSCIIE